MTVKATRICSVLGHLNDVTMIVVNQSLALFRGLTGD